MLVISNHSAFRVFGKLKYRYSIITHKHRQLPIINNIKFTYKQNLWRSKKYINLIPNIIFYDLCNVPTILESSLILS